MFVNKTKYFDAAIPVEAPIVGTVGLLAGTRVETAAGWRDVAELCCGDLLFTMDGGCRPLHDIRIAHGGDDAVRVPAGVLGADADTYLAPDQLVLVETGWAIDWLGTPVALARAGDLVGVMGIRRKAAPTRHLRMPVFAEEEILFAASGLRLFTPGGLAPSTPEYFVLLDREEAAEVLRMGPQ
ncbi:Hint domain-containing protein [Roseisalinus antarcticus]|uniref:Hedgehog/Intein (Hint) domain-containing protein n=1 Tax=Roseisalinus antarcticus TaxID=254357 RepID=A0A1Y5RCS8_9RHOB|nr:Hint domain-containing protein [Roseisalinus antarcticus]SLN13199.1 hypothetical protein ROA7023_00036 [Roseisalinus antarcticus]